MVNKSKILITFAQKSEARGTLEKFRASPLFSEKVFIWSEGFQSSLYAFEFGWILLTGMGMHSAQAMVSKYAKEAEEIWNIGFAASLKNSFPLHEFALVQNVSKHIPILKESLDPLSFECMERCAPSLPLLCDETIEVTAQTLSKTSHLVSSDFPVHDKSRKILLAEKYDLIDMEGYGVAYAASSLGKKCRMWKIISDFASEGGREIIRKNKVNLSNKIACFIEEKLCKKP